MRNLKVSALPANISGCFHIREAPLAVWTKVADYCDTTNLKARISQQENERATRFHFRQDHDSYIVAHALKRVLLGAITEADPLALSFEINNYGKPILATSLARPDIHFNISHTKGMVAVAVAHHAQIGIDVEWINPRINTSELVRSYFADQDTALLNTLPSSQKVKSFYHLWTLKEAFIKATGQGLSMPLDSFYVRSLTPTPRMIFDSKTGNPLDWITHSSMPTPEHYLSIVTECRSEKAPEPLLREIPLNALS